MRARIAIKRCLLHRRNTNIPDGCFAVRSSELNANDWLRFTDRLEHQHVAPLCGPLLLKAKSSHERIWLNANASIRESKQNEVHAFLCPGRHVCTEDQVKSVAHLVTHHRARTVKWFTC